MDKELLVIVNDNLLGRVIQLETGRLKFEYDGGWTNRIDAFPLSLSMPLAQSEHSHQVAQNYISGLLPDNVDIRRSIARQYQLGSATPFKLVSAIGEDLAGAVQMIPRSRLRRLTQRLGVTQISEKDLSEYLQSRRLQAGIVQISSDAGQFSLAGAQIKKAIYWVNDKWYEPRGRTPSTHIIKPPMPDLDGQVENEHFCLRLASRLDLPTCRSEVVFIGGKPNIVVERYDRQRLKGARALKLTEPGGTVIRIHQEDMCQALGIDPTRKYQEDGGPGMKSIMALLSSSGRPSIDRARFMRACALNFVILGTDAHGKNYSLLIEHGRFRLAPLYDINSVLPYERIVLNTKKIAMAVGGENKWRSIGLGHWQKAARETGFPADEMVETVRDLLLRAPDEALAVRNECRKGGLKTGVLTKLSDGIAKRCGAITKTYGL
jgi:serine/threonine-protein kinase HipA